MPEVKVLMLVLALVLILLPRPIIPPRGMIIPPVGDDGAGDDLKEQRGSSSCFFFRFSGQNGKNWLVPSVEAENFQSI